MSNEELLKLYDQYSEHVFRLACSFLGSPVDAEDMVQDVFLKVYEKQCNIDKGKEKAFLLKVTANCCRDYLKQANRRRVLAYDDMENELYYESLSSKESELLQAVMNLPRKYRIVIHLHYYEGYTFKEIAHILHLSPSAVSMRIHRGREELKRISREV
ncbi:MAG: RNA polymerase sigma factor [Lachnospiraceae bacterium]|nr:RNA polymerase sigma factor [Lachnospiraceae bacterium]